MWNLQCFKIWLINIKNRIQAKTTLVNASFTSWICEKTQFNPIHTQSITHWNVPQNTSSRENHSHLPLTCKHKLFRRICVWFLVCYRGTWPSCIAMTKDTFVNYSGCVYIFPNKRRDGALHKSYLFSFPYFTQNITCVGIYVHWKYATQRRCLCRFLARLCINYQVFYAVSVINMAFAPLSHRRSCRRI